MTSKRFPGQLKCAMLLENMNRIYIGLGSNIGDSLAYLADAVKRMEDCFQAQAVASSVYRSEPVELLEQPWFYNQVVRFEIDGLWNPTKVLKALKTIEEQMGREKTIRYGPRVIDLDLLLFNNWVFETAGLAVPHLKLEERSFVLLPLVELEPEIINPRTGRKLAEIIRERAAELSACERI